MADATATTKPVESSAEDSAESAAPDYDIKVEDAGPARKRLTLTVPADLIDEKLEESMGTLATETALPGFRKGRAPRKLLERRFGTAVRKETRNQIIAQAYTSAIESSELKPVGEPEPVIPLDELEIERGKPLTFQVEIEVIPAFDLPDFGKLEILKPVAEVTPEQIEEELRRQCLQNGTLEPLETDFQEGDRVLGPGRASIKGEEEPFFTHDNVDIIVPGEEEGGRGHVLGLLIDGLAGMLEGKKVGDALTFETVGPESHEREDIRGKDLVLEVTIREGQRLIPAEVAKVVEQYGFASEEILREQVKLALEQRLQEEQRMAMREQVFQHVLDAVDFELPEKLSQNQASRMLQRQRLEMMYRGGLSADDVERRLAEIRAETEEQSRQRLKLQFIMHRLAETFEVQVDEREINGRVAAIAAQRGVRPDRLRGELAQSGGLHMIALQIRDHKAADRVIDEATVKEITVEEWNKQVNQKREERARSAAGSKKTTTSKKKTSKKTSGKKTSGKKPSSKKTPSKKTSSKKSGSGGSSEEE